MLYGVNRTHANKASSAGSHIVDPGLMKGKVRVMTDEYTCLSTEVITDILQMGVALPVGARILDVVLACDDLGTTVNLSVGDAVDTTRYIPSTDVAGAATLTRMALTEVDAVLTEIISTITQILITFVAATTVVAGQKIKLIVYYTQE